MTSAVPPSSRGAQPPILPALPPYLTIRQEEVTRPTCFRMLIHGQSKLGKTTFGADLHSPGGRALSLYAAPPANHQALRDRPHVVLGSLADLEAAASQLDFGPYETVTLDDIQSVIEWAIEATAKAATKDFDDLKYGRGWGIVRRRVMSVLDAIGRRARSVLVISKTKMVTPVGEKEPSAVTPDIAPNLWQPLQGDFDLIGFAMPGPGKGRNELSFTPTRVITAGDRWGIMGAGPMPLDGAEFMRRFRENPWTPRKP